MNKPIEVIYLDFLHYYSSLGFFRNRKAVISKSHTVVLLTTPEDYIMTADELLDRYGLFK